MSQNPTNRREIRFTLSDYSKFEPFPTATDIISNYSVQDFLLSPGLPLNMTSNEVVHAEHTVTYFVNPTLGEYQVWREVIEVSDYGPNAKVVILISLEMDTAKIVKIIDSLYLRDLAG